MNEINIKKKDKVHSFRGHFLYSLGAIPSALPFNMIQGMMLTFLTLFAGLSLELYGIMLIANDNKRNIILFFEVTNN